MYRDEPRYDRLFDAAEEVIRRRVSSFENYKALRSESDRPCCKMFKIRSEKAKHRRGTYHVGDMYGVDSSDLRGIIYLVRTGELSRENAATFEDVLRSMRRLNPKGPRLTSKLIRKILRRANEELKSKNEGD